ncbi:hypothetical protein MRF4_11640 [Methylobacterium radiotolerans]|uniref:hypothetical protein n=1 Tax=Methylobacterium TaxID=407 RepID=UPI002F2C0138
MTKNLAQDIDTKYIRQIQQQNIELAVLRAELDTAVRARAVAEARSEATNKLFDAVLASLRPYGLRRKQFVFAVRRFAAAVPDHGPAALQHTVLFEGSNRILKGGSSERPRG